MKIKTVLAAFLLPVSLFVMISVMDKFFIEGDWRFFYYAAENFFDPYSVPGYYNPPSLLPAIAFVKLFTLNDFSGSGVIWQVLSVFVAVYYMMQNGAKVIDILLAFASPQFVRYFAGGQVDIISLMGLALLPGFWGAFLITAKPQTFGLAILLWLKTDTKRRLLYSVSALLVSFLIWGIWPIDLIRSYSLLPVNRDPVIPLYLMFPFGVFMAYVAWKHELYWLMALSTMFLTPYMSTVSMFPYLCVYYTHEKRMGYKLATASVMLFIGWFSAMYR